MPPKKNIPRGELENLIEQGYKLKHLAEHFGCDISTVKRRVEEYNIPFKVRFSEKKPIDYNHVIERIREGKTLKEIAKEHQMSYHTLYKRIREEIKDFDYWEIRIPRDELKRLLKRGMNIPEIANYFGVSQRTIKKRISLYNLNKFVKKEYDTTPLRLRKELLYAWYVKEGLSIPKIASALEVSESTIYRYLKIYGIPLRRKKEISDPSKEEIEKLYSKEGLTVSEVARRLGIGHSRLMKLMDGYGVKRRERSKRKYSDETLLSELKRTIERYNRIPTMKELREDPEFKINVKTYSRRFGSWKNAINMVLQKYRNMERYKAQ